MIPSHRTYKFEPGEGWKLFDVTPLVRAQAKAGRKGHGILLRFLSEDVKGRNWSRLRLRQPRRGRRVDQSPPVLLS